MALLSNNDFLGLFKDTITAISYENELILLLRQRPLDDKGVIKLFVDVTEGNQFNIKYNEEIKSLEEISEVVKGKLNVPSIEVSSFKSQDERSVSGILFELKLNKEYHDQFVYDTCNRLYDSLKPISLI